MKKQYPVGKAQQMVLDALGITATDFSDAEAKFAELGIVVSSKREGRTSIPQITILPREAGGFDAEHNGDTWKQYRKLTIAEFDAIKVWVVGEVPSDAVEKPELSNNEIFEAVDAYQETRYDDDGHVGHQLRGTDEVDDYSAYLRMVKLGRQLWLKGYRVRSSGCWVRGQADERFAPDTALYSVRRDAGYIANSPALRCDYLTKR